MAETLNRHLLLLTWPLRDMRGEFLRPRGRSVSGAVPRIHLQAPALRQVFDDQLASLIAIVDRDRLSREPLAAAWDALNNPRCSGFWAAVRQALDLEARFVGAEDYARRKRLLDAAFLKIDAMGSEASQGTFESAFAAKTLAFIEAREQESHRRLRAPMEDIALTAPQILDAGSRLQAALLAIEQQSVVAPGQDIGLPMVAISLRDALVSIQPQLRLLKQFAEDRLTEGHSGAGPGARGWATDAYKTRAEALRERLTEMGVPKRVQQRLSVAAGFVPVSAQAERRSRHHTTVSPVVVFHSASKEDREITVSETATSPPWKPLKVNARVFATIWRTGPHKGDRLRITATKKGNGDIRTVTGFDGIVIPKTGLAKEN